MAVNSYETMLVFSVANGEENVQALVEKFKALCDRKKKVSDKMAASELHFAPTTAGPDEYNIVFRHSYSKPNTEVLAIIENDMLLSKFPQL